MGTNPLVSFGDQESTEYSLNRDPPKKRKLSRWWTYLPHLRLNIYKVPGLPLNAQDQIMADCGKL